MINVKMAKLKCWKKAKGDTYVKPDEIVELKKVNFSWEKPAHNIVVYDRTINSLESSYGKVKKVMHLGGESEAKKKLNSYLEYNDKC